MFTAKELTMVSRKYFRVIEQDENVICFESRNTHHGWYIFRPSNEYQLVTSCIIFHRHENQTQFHKHGFTKTFDEAIDLIKKHDNYQINTRWGGKSFKNDKMR